MRWQPAFQPGLVRGGPGRGRVTSDAAGNSYALTLMRWLALEGERRNSAEEFGRTWSLPATAGLYLG